MLLTCFYYLAASLAHIPLLSGGTSSGGALSLPSIAAGASTVVTLSVSTSDLLPLPAALGLSLASYGTTVISGDKEFSLSHSAIPVLAKLVNKIEALKFVDNYCQTTSNCWPA